MLHNCMPQTCLVLQETNTLLSFQSGCCILHSYDESSWFSTTSWHPMQSVPSSLVIPISDGISLFPYFHRTMSSFSCAYRHLCFFFSEVSTQPFLSISLKETLLLNLRVLVTLITFFVRCLL